eukprot:5092143-Pleurochrysis_carterae.AAC.2
MESAHTLDAATSPPTHRTPPVQTEAQTHAAPGRDVPPPAHDADGTAPAPTDRRANDLPQNTATPARNVTFKRTLGDYPCAPAVPPCSRYDRVAASLTGDAALAARLQCRLWRKTQGSVSKRWRNTASVRGKRNAQR